MENINNLIQILRKQGMKVTPQRIAVCEYLYKNKSHPSADSIYNSIKPDYPSISVNTIYKTLDMLVKIGEIQKLTLTPYKNNYDPDTTPHHHLVCKDCNKIIDIPHDITKSFSLPDNIAEKYKINNYQVSFNGFCEKCQIN